MELVKLVSDLRNHTSRIGAQIEHAPNVFGECFVIKIVTLSGKRGVNYAAQEAALSSMMPASARIHARYLLFEIFVFHVQLGHCGEYFHLIRFL